MSESTPSSDQPATSLPTPASTPPLVFRSRVDLWLLALVFVPLGLAVWKTGQLVLQQPDTSDWVGFGVSTLVLVLVAWTFLTTAYEIDDTDLIVRYGPVRERVALASIRRITPSHTLLASPALSLRRLELDYAKYDTAVVSPRDEAAFIAALLARNPAIEVRDTPR